MDEGEQGSESTESQSAMLYYGIGAVVLVLVVALAYFLRPKSAPGTTPFATPVAATPTPGPITQLACEKQYYNPVIGFPKYYFSVEGVDVAPATSVSCAFVVGVGGSVSATATVSSSVTPAPGRGGSVFRCTTEGFPMEKNTAAKVDVTLTDDQNATATCTSNFLLP